MAALLPNFGGTVHSLNPDFTGFEPDIVNGRTREIWEIKSINQYKRGQAWQDLVTYIGIARAGNVHLTPGGADPALFGTLPVPGGIVRWYVPEPGIVVYEFEAMPVPIPVRDPVRERVRAASRSTNRVQIGDVATLGAIGVGIISTIQGLETVEGADLLIFLLAL